MYVLNVGFSTFILFYFLHFLIHKVKAINFPQGAAVVNFYKMSNFF